MVPMQIEVAERILVMLRDGGPWAITALSLLAIAWLARAYIRARDERDAAVSALNQELTKLVKDTVAAAAAQTASNEQVKEELDRVERRLENGPPKGV